MGTLSGASLRGRESVDLFIEANDMGQAMREVETDIWGGLEYVLKE
jgi:hypothetical protein